MTGVCEVEIESGKLFPDDSSIDILGGGSIEVIGGDEGFRNGGRIVECCTMGTNCIVLKDDQLKVEKSTVEYDVMMKINVVSVNNHGEVEQVSAGTCEAVKVDGSENMAVHVIGDLDSGEIINSDCSLIQTESSQAIDFESESPKSQLTIVDCLDSSGNLINYAEFKVYYITALGETEESRMDDGEPQIVKDDQEFLIEDVESVELNLKLQDQTNENVEIIDDNNKSQTVVVDVDAGKSVNEVEQTLEVIDDIKESQMVVMKNVEDTVSPDESFNEVEQTLKVIDDIKESHMVVMDNVEDTASPDNDATESVNEDEHLLKKTLKKTEAINDPITNESTCSQLVTEFSDVPDDKHTEFEVNEAPVFPVLIFPDTFVAPEINIQFGSFGFHEKDPNRHPDEVLEVLNREIEPICGNNSNNPERILDYLQGNKSDNKVVKDMDAVSSEFIDAQIEDTYDNRMHKVEDMIDENQLICEIELWKSYLDRDASNMGICDEIQQPLNEKNKIEERPKNLKKELNPLEDNVLKSEPEVTSLAIRTTYEENKKGKELQTPFQAADETKSISVVSVIEQGKKTEKKQTGYQTVGKVARKFNQMVKTKEPGNFLVRDSVFACLLEDEEKEPTVVEFDKKSVTLEKEEIEYNLKEQTLSEEKKKGNKQKEKAKEKRSRKKERKRTHGDRSSMDNENIAKPKETNPKHMSKQLNPKIIIPSALILILIFLSNM